MLKTLKTKTQLMSAAMMTGVLSTSGAAFAQENFNEYVGDLSDRTNAVPDLVAFLSYLGGAALAALGVVGLKQHVENPQNMPMKTPLAKLGFGGMLLALPSITNVMLETTTSSGTGAGFGTFQTSPSIN